MVLIATFRKQYLTCILYEVKANSIINYRTNVYVLHFTDYAEQQTRAYFGATLTSILRDSNPAKSSIRSLECTRLVPTCSRRQGQIASAHSNATTTCSKRQGQIASAHSNTTATCSRRQGQKASAHSNTTTTCSRRQGNITSAHSRTTTTNSSPRSLSRAVSADSRGFSAVSTSAGSISKRVSSKGNNLLSAPGHKTVDLCTHLRLCRSGLTVWTLQNEVLQDLSISEHGCFHQANCYMVLQSDQENGIGDTFLYVWSGSQSCKADYDVLLAYAEECDKYFGGVSFMSLEYEGHETISFLRNFPDGIIVDGGKSRQNSRNSIKCVKRLYKVIGRSYPSAICIEPSDKTATENDILILDGYPRMYVWVGQQTDFVRRVKAIKLANKIRSRQWSGRCHIIVVEQKDKQMSDAFLTKLDSLELSESDAEKTTVIEVTNCKPCLYKINGPRILYDMPLVAAQPLKQKYLTSQDSFLLVNGSSCPLYIWVGNSADADAIYDALRFAVNFKQHYSRPMNTAVCRVREGNEPVGFIKAFIDWKNKLKKHGSAVNDYPITNTDRSSHRTDGSSPGESFQSGNGKTQIWQVSGETLDSVPAQNHRVFYNHRCYIIFNRAKMSEDQLVIYLWVGSKTSINEQAQVMTMALTMNSLMEHKATIIRVFDGREQHHFIRTMHGAIIVYDVCLVHDNSVAEQSSIDNNAEFFNSTIMFRVQKLEPDCVRMSQVSPLSTSLNSAAVFVIITRETSVLWYGKKSSAQERECAKYMLAYVCPERQIFSIINCRYSSDPLACTSLPIEMCSENRLHDYDIIIEGREPTTFWSLVQHNGDYPKQLSEFKLPRHFPTLALCSRKLAMWSFTDIPDFSKEDLCETDIFILDTHDQIQLWIGSCFLGGDDQETLSNLIQAYISLDQAGRHESDLHVLFCHQGYEPSLFRKYFRGWNCHEYGGEVAYEKARRHLRQENADINIDCLVNYM